MISKSPAVHLFKNTCKISRHRPRPQTLFFILITSLFSANLSHAADDFLLLPAVNLLLSRNTTCGMSYADNNPKYDLQYKGLYYYQNEMSHTRYGLQQLSDSDFNQLSLTDRRKVADKLLSSLFFGYPAKALDQRITSSSFLCSVRRGLFEKKNDMARVEKEIRNDERYYHHEYYNNDVHDILARFYAMQYLDSHYLHNWVAYILTQTIMFSPAYELESSHYPNSSRVYNWLVMDMDDDVGMRYSTFLHMTGSDNWRRFRSPEDNGREMLEIFTFDFNDADVPKAATTLQNWYLDADADTLVIGLNENVIPQSLFGTSVTTGFDFYRELVKSDGFINGSVRRLVDFFFTDHDEVQKAGITHSIVTSHPETWEDVLLQILFSREYLLKTSRVKSAEELFYSLTKKLEYKHWKYTFVHFNDALIDMNQAAMKYKLGKLERTPLDTLSFAHYHKYIRERILLRNVCGEGEKVYDSWDSYGWRPQLLDNDRFNYIADNPEATLDSFITYLFKLTIHRKPTYQEMEMFKNNMLTTDRREYQWRYNFRRVNDDGCYSWRENAAEDVLDYISRLSELYMFQEVR